MCELASAGAAGASEHHWHPAFRPNTVEDTQPHSAASDIADEQPEVGAPEGGPDAAQELGSTRDNHGALELGQTQGKVSADSPNAAFSEQMASGDLSTSQRQEAPESAPRDALEAAWGSYALAPPLQHTNSFPAVPPLKQQEQVALDAGSIPHSQAEAVLKEAVGAADGAHEDPWAHTADPFFSQEQQFQDELEMGAGDLEEPTDAEARYEEGVPLVPKEEQSFGEAARAAAEPFEASGDSFDAFGADTAQDDFFSNVSNPADAQHEPAPGHLPRKSTEQILSSMDTSNSHSQSPALEAIAHTSASLRHASGGGIAVSTTTIVSQVLSEELGQAKDESAESSNMKEEDLAALWQAALGDDELLEDDSAMDPSSFFEDDGEGFLIDPAPEDMVSPPIPTPVHDASGQLKGFDSLSRPSTGQATQQYTPTGSGSGAYAPYANQSMPQPTVQYGQQPARSMSSYSQYGRQAIPTPTPASQTSGPQSFADKAKGGYTSPFDAPMDLSRPKRRTTQPIQLAAPQQNAQSMPPPPPRSSSMAPPSSINAAQSPQTGYQPGTPSYQSSAQGSEARPQSKSSSSSFFEELPITSRPRPPSAMARSPPNLQSPPPAQGMSSPPKPTTAPPASYGLVAPQRQMNFGDGAPQVTPQSPYTAQPQASKTAPPANARYSPAPGAIPTESPARNRYAAHPQGGVPPRVPSISNANQYQPRTSSPLLHSSSASQIQPRSDPVGVDIAAHPPTQATANYAPILNPNHAPLHQAPVLAQAFDPSLLDRPQVRQGGMMHQQAPAFTSHGPSMNASQPPPRSGVFHDERSFLRPNDGTEHDAMKRWQGAPILRFGFGGSIVTSFPKRVPRFTANQAAPAIKCAPGEINIHSTNLLPLDEVIASFPGPLKARSKKKDVLNWLNNAIARLEHETSGGGFDPQSEPMKRRTENLLLWKILRVFVEYDGAIDANPAAMAAVRLVLTPEVQDSPQDGNISTYYQSPAIIAHGERSVPASAQPGATEEIRKLLLRGEREKAVWLAADQKLWGHAMLIGSTMPPEVWKQVSQEFVKNEVKMAGDNTESLAALYDVFSGNWEESMDRLVPSSTRAGLQMVSKTATSGPSKNLFEGLDRWRETLSMVLSNRSAEDGRSLASLGQMLSTYGRTEAAHICYLFSHMPGFITGADDPQAAVVLLGGDHRQYPSSYAQDIYSVLLTEVYEFAVCVLPANPVPAFGHLQSFKLWHATMLAESGSSDQAQQYCDAIAGALKASTKASPYYHARLFAAVDELSTQIRSAPRDGSGSWISKPSMDKVSGSMWSKFTSFVAGDESDAASVTSKAETEGPFAMISGDTPPAVSRGPSPSERASAYGNLNGYMPAAAKAIPGNSRYAPKGQATSEPNSVNRQPSISSFGSASPDYHRSQGLQSHALPAQALSYSPGRDSSLYAPQNAPAGGQHSSIPPVQPQVVHNSSRSPSDGGIASGLSAPGASPYDPHPARSVSPYESRPSNYAPRAPTYEPRSYQPSPKPADPVHSDYSYTAMAEAPKSVPPHISTAGGDFTDPLETPRISEVPPTPKASQYGYEAQYPAQPAAPEAEEQAMPGYDPHVAATEVGYTPAAGGYEPPASSYEPPSMGYEPPSSSSYEPSSMGYEPPSSSYEAPSSSYEPPGSSYAPPSSEGYATAPLDADTNGAVPAAKPRGIMDLSDDEDDLVARAASLKKAQRAENDRQADQAFRLAAEADAARDKAGGNRALASKGSGWLGGWFSRGKSDEGAAMGANGDGSKKPIKARLGEESSFYYDADLKKWVNKKAGAESAAPVAPTPPPPRGGASLSRAASAGPPPMGNRMPTSNPSGTPPTGGPPMGGPPMGGPPSRTGSPAGAGAEDGPPTGLAAGAAPPSRPGTGMSGMSNASSIDDLLVAAGPRRAGGTARKAKKKGYVDIMAK